MIKIFDDEYFLDEPDDESFILTFICVTMMFIFFYFS
jgi:hypothetical protein